MTLLGVDGALLTRPLPDSGDPPPEPYASNAWQLPIGNATELAQHVVPSEGKQHGRSAHRNYWIDENDDIQGDPDSIDVCHDIGQIVHSGDNGFTFERPLNDGLHHYAMHTVRSDPINPDRAVCLVGRNNTAPGSCVPFAGLHLSTNGKATWVPQHTVGDVSGLGYPGTPYDARLEVDRLQLDANGQQVNPTTMAQMVIVPDLSTARYPVGHPLHDPDTWEGIAGCKTWWAAIGAGSKATNTTTGYGWLIRNNGYAAGAWSFVTDVSDFGNIHGLDLTRDGALMWIATGRRGACKYATASGTVTRGVGAGVGGPGASARITRVWVDPADEDSVWVGQSGVGVFITDDDGASFTQSLADADMVHGPFVNDAPGSFGNRVAWVACDAVANGTQNRYTDDNGGTWGNWADVRSANGGGARPGYTDGHQVNPRAQQSFILPDPRDRTHAWGFLNANFWRTDGGDPGYWRFSDTGWTGINANRSTHGVVEDASTPRRILVCSTDTGPFLSDPAADADAARAFAQLPSPDVSLIPNGKKDAKAALIIPDGTGQRLVVSFGGAGARLFKTETRGADGWVRPNGQTYYNSATEVMAFIDAIGADPDALTIYCGRVRLTNSGASSSLNALASPYATAEFLALNDDGTIWRWLPSYNGTRELLRGTWTSPTLLTGWSHSLRAGGTNGLAQSICFATPKSDSTRFWAPAANDDLARVRVTSPTTTWETTGLRAAIYADGAAPAGFPFHFRDVSIDPVDPNIVTALVLESGVPPAWRTENGETADPGDIVWENVSDDLPRVGRGNLGLFASRRDVTFHSQAGIWLLPPVAAGDEPSLSTLAAAYQFNDPAFAL